ncbi:hypothetical protein HYT45_00950 [Candidatus Uhrbacteria bacterium]|nr:hypothetical protein [Candidatus Uhrbacteria bacterium]
MLRATIENDYAARLEQSRLEESLADPPDQEDSGEAAQEKESAGGILERLGKKTQKTGKTLDAAAKAVATGQYAVWQIIWDAFAPTFGLSLLLIYVLIFSWLGKKFFPEAIAGKLPEPGEDGLLGIVPPPPPNVAKFVTPFYGLVNKLAMGVLFMILTPILLILFIAPFAPLIFAYQFGSTVLGPLGEILESLFGR